MNVTKKDILYDNITYNNPKKINNKHISKALYNNNNLVVQINGVSTPFGIYKDNGKYKIDIIIENEKYLELFNKIENNSILNLARNYTNWFSEGKGEEDKDEDDTTFDEIKCNLHSNIKFSQEYAVLTIILESSNNNMNFEVYNSNKERVSWKSIKRDSKISLIIHYNGIRFYKTKFSNDWIINQIKINEEYIVDNLEKNVCYINDSDEEDSYIGYENVDELDIEYEEESNYINKFLMEEYRKKKQMDNLQKC